MQSSTPLLADIFLICLLILLFIEDLKKCGNAGKDTTKKNDRKQENRKAKKKMVLPSQDGLGRTPECSNIFQPSVTGYDWRRIERAQRLGRLLRPIARSFAPLVLRRVPLLCAQIRASTSRVQ